MANEFALDLEELRKLGSIAKRPRAVSLTNAEIINLEKLKLRMDNEKDPMPGIMDLLKNMYAEVDEEMKKTIAKAWTDARTGKGDYNLQVDSLAKFSTLISADQHMKLVQRSLESAT